MSHLFKLCSLVGSLSIFCVFAGCSGAADGSRCVIGQSVACACTNGKTGAQVCEDGSRYSLCSCEPTSRSGGDGGDIFSGNDDMRAPTGKRVFFTSASYDGKLAALFSGDNIDQLCQTAANGAGLGGNFITWAVSPAGVVPINRITAQGPWYGLDGKLAFNNKANLMTTPMNPIVTDEFKQSCTFCNVWTGLSSGGVPVTSCYYNKYWNENSSTTAGRMGFIGSSTSTWIDYRDDACSNQNHLICIEN